MNPLWTFPLSLPDLGAIAGLVVALFGLGTNTFQLRVLVRQIRLDALIRIADSSRRFAVIAIERAELWEAMQIVRRVDEALESASSIEIGSRRPPRFMVCGSILDSQFSRHVGRAALADIVIIIKN